MAGENNSDEGVKILREIRDEIRGTNSRIDGTNSRIDGTNSRIDSLEKSLGDRVDSLEDRVDSLGGKFDSLGDSVDSLGGRVDSLEKVMRTTNSHVAALENVMVKGFSDLQSEMSELRSETRTGLSTVTDRLDNIRDLAGHHHRKLEERVLDLEKPMDNENPGS